MASILGNYAVAREQAYFKKEQEADLQRYIEKLKKAGIIVEDSGNRYPPKRFSLKESEQKCEVLFEIMQREGRLHIPDAALRQEYKRRVKGMPPRLTEEEIRQWRAKSLASIGTIPKMDLGRNRFVAARSGFEAKQLRIQQMSPAAKEAAKREFMAALRSLVYGSMFGVLGVVAVGTVICHQNGIKSVSDLKSSIQSWAVPLGEDLQENMSPFKKWARGITSKWQVKVNHGEGGSEGQKYQTEFSKALKEKFRKLH